MSKRSVTMRSGAWNVVENAARGTDGALSVAVWRHGQGFVTEAVNAGLIERSADGSLATLTERGVIEAARLGIQPRGVQK